MRQNHVACKSAFRMASSFELNTVVFMEEIQKYDCLYNKFIKDYKKNYKKFNCWSKTGEKFDIDPAVAENKFKNVHTAYDWKIPDE